MEPSLFHAVSRLVSDVCGSLLFVALLYWLHQNDAKIARLAKSQKKLEKQLRLLQQPNKESDGQIS